MVASISQGLPKLSEVRYASKRVNMDILKEILNVILGVIIWGIIGFAAWMIIRHIKQER